MSETREFEHPNYWAIWGLLFILTAVEVGVAYLPWARPVVVVLLLGMAVWKALLVALFFMHLRYEKARMWIVAAAPLPLAVIIVIAGITEFLR